MTGSLCKLPNKKRAFQVVWSTYKYIYIYIIYIYLCICIFIYIYTYIHTPWNNHLFLVRMVLSNMTSSDFHREQCDWVPSPIRPMCHIYSIPFETCHITRVHDLLILDVGSKSFAEPTAFHHLDEPQGWGNFRHPLSGANSRQRTLTWSHSMESFKGFRCKI